MNIWRWDVIRLPMCLARAMPRLASVPCATTGARCWGAAAASAAAAAGAFVACAAWRFRTVKSSETRPVSLGNVNVTICIVHRLRTSPSPLCARCNSTVRNKNGFSRRLKAASVEFGLRTGFRRLLRADGPGLNTLVTILYLAPPGKLSG